MPVGSGWHVSWVAVLQLGSHHGEVVNSTGSQWGNVSRQAVMQGPLRPSHSAPGGGRWHMPIAILGLQEGNCPPLSSKMTNVGRKASTAVTSAPLSQLWLWMCSVECMGFLSHLILYWPPFISQPKLVILGQNAPYSVELQGILSQGHLNQSDICLQTL